MSVLHYRLEELKGQEVFVDVIGKTFAPKGILKEIGQDYIQVGKHLIPISSIAYLQPVDKKVRK